MHLEGESTGLEKRLLLALFVAVIVIISGFAYLFLGGSAPVEESFIGVISVDGPILTVEGPQAIVGAISIAFTGLFVLVGVPEPGRAVE